MFWINKHDQSLSLLEESMDGLVVLLEYHMACGTFCTGTGTSKYFHRDNMKS